MAHTEVQTSAMSVSFVHLAEARNERIMELVLKPRYLHRKMKVSKKDA
jgi:hypothetical protein